MRKGIVVLLMVVVFLCVTGCAPCRAPGYKAVTFRCEEGKTLVVFFSESGEHAQILFPDGRELILHRAISGSGARYIDGKTTFWTKGQGAFLEVDGKVVIRDCLAVDEK
ncbi:MAG: MliC family protein [Deltaproteobacteria bacterium]|nr:MliC family protein [Deltaproteobacteria bacterium]